MAPTLERQKQLVHLERPLARSTPSFDAWISTMLRLCGLSYPLSR
jgi:hypothetical protein